MGMRLDVLPDESADIHKAAQLVGESTAAWVRRITVREARRVIAKRK